MANTHGGARENAGRPKGSVNEKTKAWEKIGEYLTEQGAERFAQVMTDSDDKNFMSYYLAILDYFKPRMNRTAITGPEGKGININVTFDDEPQNPNLPKGGTVQ